MYLVMDCFIFLREVDSFYFFLISIRLSYNSKLIVVCLLSFLFYVSWMLFLFRFCTFGVECDISCTHSQSTTNWKWRNTNEYIIYMYGTNKVVVQMNYDFWQPKIDVRVHKYFILCERKKNQRLCELFSNFDSHNKCH